MIGKAVSLNNNKYNIIILAGGAGSRMGIASDFIPKALTKLGEMRAIDFIIERYQHLAHKFIIGTGYHSDLLISYINGRYKNINNFSIEKPEKLQNNCYSTLYCLDHADSRHGTIITFCDLIMLDNLIVDEDSVYYVSENTRGLPGTFRHSIKFNIDNSTTIFTNDSPKHRSNGLLGTFVLSDTPLLKSILYSNYSHLNDLTEDGIIPYSAKKNLIAKECTSVYEFGNEDDLNKVRELWENA